MVCYARPALRMAAVVLVVLVILGRSGVQLFPGHFDGTAALMVAISVAAGVAVVAAALTFVAFGSIRRRRAVAGGCVHCQFRCQQAMTGAPPPRRPAGQAAQPELASPRWPDRPVHRSGLAAQPAALTAQPGGAAARSAGQGSGQGAGRGERRTRPGQAA